MPEREKMNFVDKNIERWLASAAGGKPLTQSGLASKAVCLSCQLSSSLFLLPSHRHTLTFVMPPLRSGRASKACELCRKHKTRCYDSDDPGGSCLRCQTLSQPCSLSRSDSNVGLIASNISRSPVQPHRDGRTDTEQTASSGAVSVDER